jgi:SAM-dependent methyltransferase
MILTLGVAHHSPHPPLVFKELLRVLKPGGTLCGWVYAKHRSYLSPARAKFRAFTTDPANSGWVKHFSEQAPALRDLSVKGRWDELREVLGISTSRYDEECILDTLDWVTPEYQFQYTEDEMRQMLIGLGVIDVLFLPFPVSFRARKQT